MTGPARVIVLGISALLVAGGLALQASVGQGWFLMGFGMLIAASVLLEGRYRGSSRNSLDHGSWQRTGEREIDSETGKIVDVWFDPTTGERRYQSSKDT